MWILWFVIKVYFNLVTTKKSHKIRPTWMMQWGFCDSVGCTWSLLRYSGVLHTSTISNTAFLIEIVPCLNGWWLLRSVATITENSISDWMTGGRAEEREGWIGSGMIDVRCLKCIEADWNTFRCDYVGKGCWGWPLQEWDLETKFMDVDLFFS